MSSIYFAVKNSLTDCVQSNDTALVLLPGAKQPVMVATYCERLYPGVRTLLGIGNPEAIIKQDGPTLTGNPPSQDLLEKRAELDTASRFCNRLRSELSARVGIVIKFLGSRKLLDRKLYPLNDKLKQKIQPNNKVGASKRAAPDNSRQILNLNRLSSIKVARCQRLAADLKRILVSILQKN